MRFKRHVNPREQLFGSATRIVFLALVLFLSFSFDYGDPALMLERSLYPSFEVGPSGHPLLYLLLYLPAKLMGDEGIAAVNFLFGIASALVMVNAASALGLYRPRKWLSKGLFVALLVSHTLLIKTLSVDVYALQALLNALIFWAAIKAEKSEGLSAKSRYFLLFGGFLGLQVANHLWAVFLLPAAIWWGISMLGRRQISLKTLLLGGVLSLIAAGPFTIPSFMLMASEGFGAWYQAALGGDEVGGKFFGYTFGESPRALALGLGMLVFQFPFLIWIAPLGSKLLRKRASVLWVFFLLVFIPNAAASMLYKENHAYEVMLTHYQVLFLFIAAGTPSALAWLRTCKHWAKPGGVLILTALVLPIGLRALTFVADQSGVLKLQSARDFPFRNESAHFVAGLPMRHGAGSDYALAVFREKLGAAVILADWSFWTVLHRVDVESNGSETIVPYSESAARRAFWESPDLLDGNHYCVTNEAIYAEPAAAKGGKLVGVGEALNKADGFLIYRIVPVKSAPLLE